MITAITACFNSISNAFKCFTTSKERQSETEVVRVKKRKDKAINIAEKIIFLADQTSLKDNRRYRTYRKLFFKYN